MALLAVEAPTYAPYWLAVEFWWRDGDRQDDQQTRATLESGQLRVRFARVIPHYFLLCTVALGRANQTRGTALL